jgi:hypothetical protein
VLGPPYHPACQPPPSSSPPRTRRGPSRTGGYGLQENPGTGKPGFVILGRRQVDHLPTGGSSVVHRVQLVCIDLTRVSHIHISFPQAVPPHQLTATLRPYRLSDQFFLEFIANRSGSSPASRHLTHRSGHIFGYDRRSRGIQPLRQRPQEDWRGVSLFRVAALRRRDDVDPLPGSAGPCSNEV